MTAQPFDFTEISSLEKALALFQMGKLEKLYLFPPEFGGKDTPQNMMYVPPGIAEIKRRIDAMIGSMAKDGLVSKYVAEPEYKGASFIPSKIKIQASHPDKPSTVNPTINIW
jgi:hypothetical protein